MVNGTLRLEMNCEDCLAQLDEYHEQTLSSAERVVICEHLEKCDSCHDFYRDLIVILDNCEHVQAHLETPPNAQALWLRISNTIECEQQSEITANTKAGIVATNNAGWWTRAMETSWKLSLQQMITAVLGVAVISALLTVVALQNTFSNQNGVLAAQSNLFSPSWNSSQTEAAARNIELESRLKQQQMAIDYWNHRVALRKTRWNRDLRDAFERNLQAIDSVVADYKEQLQHNPDDSISEEMLDSALNDKMALLREFSEL